jgi:hypothetical protein
MVVQKRRRLLAALIGPLGVRRMKLAIVPGWSQTAQNLYRGRRADYFFDCIQNGVVESERFAPVAIEVCVGAEYYAKQRGQNQELGQREPRMLLGG